MSGFVRRSIGMLGFLLVLGTPLWAQENLDKGKTGAQLFATDCAVCHKSPQALAARGGGGILGLESFLREHYTASRESAAAIAGYLRGMSAPPAAARPAKGKGKKSDDKAKATDKKPDAPKPGDAKPDVKSEDKPAAAAKPAEAKPAEAKPGKPKAAGPKAAAPKPAEPGKAE